ncbi:hypothetical protein [Vibrio harveyi]|uniref:hypothetical protein n=1 Tax=Vibrio harveyi TaxID=669 RepID=UPI003BB60426
MMKQIALIALTALTLAYPAMAKNKPYSKEVETFLDASAATCPTCADVSEYGCNTQRKVQPTHHNKTHSACHNRTSSLRFFSRTAKYGPRQQAVKLPICR